MAGGAIYELSGGISVDGPASAFVCSFRRALGASYGRNRKVGTVTFLVKPVLCLCGACTFYGEVLIRLSKDDRARRLTMPWNVLVDDPLSLFHQ